MKNGEVLKLYKTLMQISKNPDLKFSVTLGYAMAKNKEKLRQEATLIYDMRQKILLEHGKIEGDDIIVPGEFADETYKKIDELMGIENDIQVMKVPLDWFEGCELNIEEIEGLMGMIHEVTFTGPPIKN